jgi:hypothetical protein
VGSGDIADLDYFVVGSPCFEIKWLTQALRTIELVRMSKGVWKLRRTTIEIRDDQAEG